jgi:pyruvate dehydrogenase E2 component (dihydrolipoamide acetyltransferase)
MPTPLNMPQVGQDIPAARIVEWTRREGEPVQPGDVVAVVESDKATFDVQADRSGFLLKILVNAGEEGAVFQPIAWIGEPGEQIPAGSPEHAPGRSALPDLSPNQEATLPAHPLSDQRRFASPSARRVAREQGVDLAGVEGTGPGGRIVKRDVLAACENVGLDPSGLAPWTSSDEVHVFTRTRRRIAERLTLSTRSIPHFHLFHEVDMTSAQAWRRGYNEINGSHLTVTDLVLHATARALTDFPLLNAHVGPDRLVARRAVNLGVATSTEDGLLVPVIADAAGKELSEISRLSKALANAARRGKVDPGIQGTFTVTSLGSFGIPAFLPIINPPECAILAVGAVQPRLVAFDGGVTTRQMMTLTLACDHRAVDGVYAAQFLTWLKELIETTWQAKSSANQPSQ